MAIAMVIGCNFLVNCIEAAILPETDEGQRVFKTFEWIFNALFFVELCLNMFGHWFFEFWGSGWCVFDFTVVVTGVLSIVLPEGTIPGIGVLRLFRAFRVFRLFKKLPALKQILVGVFGALPGVSHAFILLGLIMGIWSIMGVEFFKDQAPEFYGTFSKAMLTQFQVMTFDGWVSQIARDLIYQNGWTSSIYFITYVFAASIIFMNVIVAILIDRYLSATNKDSIADTEEEEYLEELLQVLKPRLATLEERLAVLSSQEAAALRPAQEVQVGPGMARVVPLPA